MIMPLDPLDLMTKKLALHAPLSGEDRAAIRTLPMIRRKLGPLAYVIREDDKPTVCAVLISGFAMRQKIAGDGGRKIVSVHIPGEILDLQNLFLDTSDHNVQTLGNAEIGIIPRPALQDLSHSNNGVGHAILVCLLVEASISREWQLNIARRPARARMAHFFCEMGVRLEAQGLSDIVGYSFPMTQVDIADALGLTPVHVNRTIRTLERDGLISRTRSDVSFPRWKELLSIADFNPNYLHIAQH